MVDFPDKDVTPAVTEVQNAEGNYMEVFSGNFMSECVEAIATLSGDPINEIMNVVHALEKAELLSSEKANVEAATSKSIFINFSTDSIICTRPMHWAITAEIFVIAKDLKQLNAHQ